MSKYLLFAFMIMVLPVSGCAKKPGEAQSGKVIARINNYELTEEDFRNEVDQKLAKRYASGDAQRNKELLLDEIIEKKLLVQQAQKEDLDKQKDFMREIERYWEQSLIKLMLKKKAALLQKTVEVNDSDIEEEYLRMQKLIQARIVSIDKEDLAVKLSRAEERFDDMASAVANSSNIRSSVVDWYAAGDLPQTLETVLFSLKKNEISKPYLHNGKWFVIKVMDEKTAGIKPIGDLKNEIRIRILSEKREKLLKEWIDSLRDEAVIKINKKNLESIKLDSD